MPSNTEIYHTGPGKFNSHGNYNGRSRNVLFTYLMSLIMSGIIFSKYLE